MPQPGPETVAAEWDPVPSALPWTRAGLEIALVAEVWSKRDATSRPSYVLRPGTKLDEGDVEPEAGFPVESALEPVLRKALASVGFLPPVAGEAPALLITFWWGCFNYSNHSLRPAERRHFLECAALVGGESFAQALGRASDDERSMGPLAMDAFANRDDRTRWLVAQAETNRYYIVISAYDLAAYRRGVSRLQWRVKLSTDSRHAMGDEAVATMLMNCGQLLGRATAGAARLFRPAAGFEALK